MTIVDARADTRLGDLVRRGRRAYESGRIRRAILHAALAAAVAGLALVGCPAPGGPLACLAALVLLIGLCVWRGGPWARGAGVGFAASLLPCLLPAALTAAGACSASYCLTLPRICLVAGFLAGAWVSWRGLAVRGDHRFWLASAAAVLLGGTVGCLPGGLAAVGGMALGMLLGASAPALIARPAA